MSGLTRATAVRRVVIVASVLVVGAAAMEAQRPTPYRVASPALPASTVELQWSRRSALDVASQDSAAVDHARDWAVNGALAGAFFGLGLWYVASRRDCGGDAGGYMCDEGAPWRMALTGAAIGWVAGLLMEVATPKAGGQQCWLPNRHCYCRASGG